jgi:chemotaxis protein MotB
MRHQNGYQNNQRSTGGGWQVIYTGFVLILLSLFILLSSFATLEQTKVLQFVESFADAVSILPGGRAIVDGPLVAPPETAESRRFMAEMQRIREDLHEWVAHRGMDDAIDLILQDEGLVLRFREEFIFSIGSAAISMKIVPLLNKIGQTIVATGYPVKIEGHTDNVPIRTQRYPSNWELSTARAVNVLRYFTKYHGIPADRLTAVGCGAYQPLTSNDTWQNRATNRRVEILFQREP